MNEFLQHAVLLMGSCTVGVTMVGDPSIQQGAFLDSCRRVTFRTIQLLPSGRIPWDAPETREGSHMGRGGQKETLASLN